MLPRLVLASGSKTRADLLRAARVPFDTNIPNVDEEQIKTSLVQACVAPLDVSAQLAEAKALKVSNRHPEDVVLGCDQVLDHQGQILSKPRTRQDAVAQLTVLSGTPHKLHTSAVICQAGRPTWRHVSSVSLTMRRLEPDYIDVYVDRNWPDISGCVGGYQIEAEGSRLFTAVQGDYFSILGLPLLPVLNQLIVMGVLEG